MFNSSKAGHRPLQPCDARQEDDRSSPSRQRLENLQASVSALGNTNRPGVVVPPARDPAQQNMEKKISFPLPPKEANDSSTAEPEFMSLIEQCLLKSENRSETADEILNIIADVCKKHLQPGDRVHLSRSLQREEPEYIHLTREDIQSFRGSGLTASQIESLCKMIPKEKSASCRTLLQNAYKADDRIAATSTLKLLNLLKKKQPLDANVNKRASDCTLLGSPDFWKDNRPGWLDLVLAEKALDLERHGHRSPLVYALRDAPDAYGIEALLEAAADPNHLEMGYTPLHLAVAGDSGCLPLGSIDARLDKVKALIEPKKTELNRLTQSREREPESFLHLAVRKDYLPELEIVARDDRANVNILSGGAKGCSPLALAAERFLSPGGIHYKNLEGIIRVLLQQNARLVLSDTNGQPVDFGQDIDRFVAELKRRENQENQPLLDAAETLCHRQETLAAGIPKEEHHAQKDYTSLFEELQKAFLSNDSQRAISTLIELKPTEEGQRKYPASEDLSLLHQREFHMKSSPGWRALLIKSGVFDISEPFKPSPDSTTEYNHHASPLTLACLLDPDARAVDELLQKGANPNRARDARPRDTPLQTLLDKNITLIPDISPPFVFGPAHNRYAKLEKLSLLLAHPLIEPNLLSCDGEALLSILVLDKEEDSLSAMEMLLDKSLGRSVADPNILGIIHPGRHRRRHYYQVKSDFKSWYCSPLAYACSLFLTSPTMEENRRDVLSKKIQVLVQANGHLVIDKRETQEPSPTDYKLEVDRFIEESGITPVDESTTTALKKLIQKGTGAMLEKRPAPAPFSLESRKAAFRKLVEENAPRRQFEHEEKTSHQGVHADAGAMRQ